MKKFVNNPDLIVDDMLQGYVLAHGESIHISAENDHVVVKNKMTPGKVGVVSGGGSGHEPCFLGFIGDNLLDAVAVGEVFSSPPATAFLQAFKEADTGSGVACIIGNYAGDTMNVKMAIQMAAMQGIQVKFVAGKDDISSSPKETKEKRHGIAGNVFIWKIACAAASRGANLEEVIDIAQKAIDATRSICVGLNPLTIPALGHPNFEIKEGMLEFGIGHHGEAGFDEEPILSAKEIGERLVRYIVDDINLSESDEVGVCLSGLGATPLMEQYVVFGSIIKQFDNFGIIVCEKMIGNYVTSLDMNGLALTVIKIDELFKQYLEVPTKSVALTK